MFEAIMIYESQVYSHFVLGYLDSIYSPDLNFHINFFFKDDRIVKNL